MNLKGKIAIRLCNPRIPLYHPRETNLAISHYYDSLKEGQEGDIRRVSDGGTEEQT